MPSCSRRTSVFSCALPRAVRDAEREARGQLERLKPKPHAASSPRSRRMSATARASAPKRTGSVTGRPVRCVACSSARRASPSSSCARVERQRQHRARGASSPRRARCRGSAPTASGCAARARRRCSFRCVRPCSWQRMSASGQAPCMSASVTPEYAGWCSEPWPSTITMSASRGGLEHQLLDHARDEVGGHRVHRDAGVGDEDAGLARGDERRAHAAPLELGAHFERGGHLAHVAVAAHREHDQRVDVRRRGARRWAASAGGRRTSMISQPCASRQRGQLGIVARGTRAARRSRPSRAAAPRPPRRATTRAARRPAGRCRCSSASGSNAAAASRFATTGMSPPTPTHDCAVRPARVESITATTSSGR